MVQILPPRETFGGMIGRGLGGGFSQGISEALKGGSERRTENRKEESQMRLLQEKARLDQEKLMQKQEFLNQLFSGENAQDDSEQEIELSEKNSGKFDPSQVSDEDIARVSAVDPNIGRSLQHSKDVALREKREVTKSKEKKAAVAQAETLGLRKEIADKGNSARRGIENKEKLMQLIDTGNLDDPTFATLAEALPLNLGKRMLSPETVEYKAGLIEEFGDLRKLFQGQTRVKEIELLEQKIADLYLTDEQKKTILKSRINALRADIIREDAASEIESEGMPIGVLQFNKEVEKIAKPKLNALFNQILDEQSAIIKNAENRKKIALDSSDPDDMQIVDQILKEAGGDWRKAEKLAKQKGYNF